jgi:acyl-CoA synthetase (NDP forming)
MHVKSGGIFELDNNIKTLNEFDAAALLRQRGITFVDNFLAKDYKEVEVAAQQWGFPVVLKICSENVPHKTERGGGTLDIRDVSSLEKAFQEMNKRFF